MGLGVNGTYVDVMCVSSRLKWFKSKHTFSILIFLVRLLGIDTSANAGKQILKMEQNQKETGHLSHCLEESCLTRNTYLELEYEQNIYWDFLVFWYSSWYHLD